MKKLVLLFLVLQLFFTGCNSIKIFQNNVEVHSFLVPMQGMVIYASLRTTDPNLVWNAFCRDATVIIYPASGRGSVNKISITIPEWSSLSRDGRSFPIRFRPSGAVVNDDTNITICQKDAWQVSPQSFSIPQLEGATSISVLSNLTISIVSQPQWANVNITHQVYNDPNKTLAVTCRSNNTATTREGIIKIKEGGHSCSDEMDIRITQPSFSCEGNNNPSSNTTRVILPLLQDDLHNCLDVYTTVDADCTMGYNTCGSMRSTGVVWLKTILPSLVSSRSYLFGFCAASVLVPLQEPTISIYRNDNNSLVFLSNSCSTSERFAVLSQAASSIQTEYFIRIQGANEGQFRFSINELPHN